MKFCRMRNLSADTAWLDPESFWLSGICREAAGGRVVMLAVNTGKHHFGCQMGVGFSMQQHQQLVQRGGEQYVGARSTAAQPQLPTRTTAPNHSQTHTFISIRKAGSPNPSAFFTVSSSRATTIAFLTPAAAGAWASMQDHIGAETGPEKRPASSSKSTTQHSSSSSSSQPAIKMQPPASQLEHYCFVLSSTASGPSPRSAQHAHPRLTFPAAPGSSPDRRTFSAHTDSMPPGQA